MFIITLNLCIVAMTVRLTLSCMLVIIRIYSVHRSYRGSGIYSVYTEYIRLICMKMNAPKQYDFNVSLLYSKVKHTKLTEQADRPCNHQSQGKDRY